MKHPVGKDFWFDLYFFGPKRFDSVSGLSVNLQPQEHNFSRLGQSFQCGGGFLMIDKSAFTAEEWKLVLSSPMLAGMAVTLSDPSGLIGLMKESVSSATALQAVKKDDSANAIAKAIASEYETSEGRSLVRDNLKSEVKGKAPADAKQAALDGLKRVAAILDAKAPAEAPAFKAWLKSIAVKTAEAASEGGFMGFGGVQVSDAEKATLAEIESALA
jgi:hypothetical protein